MLHLDLNGVLELLQRIVFCWNLKEILALSKSVTEVKILGTDKPNMFTVVLRSQGGVTFLARNH
jgi:hypothetical protein